MTGRLTATGYLIHLDIFADHMTSGQHCQPARTAFLSTWWSFLSLAGTSLLCPRVAMGLMGLAGSRAPFVCDQHCLSAGDLSSIHCKYKCPHPSQKIRDALMREIYLSLLVGCLCSE